MTDAQTLDSEENPAWVLEPPDSVETSPPVDTLAQELPFDKLTWQNFERLCLRLASMDGDVEYCRLYGTAGQEQGGIDIYIRRTSTTKYATWQSKRHKSFNSAKIDAAVAEFLAGEWAGKSDRFVLCVQASLRSTGTADKIEECACRLREKGIDFQALDGEHLSQRLKSLPEIVCDFFGVAWVERFCGRQAVEVVSKRLTPSEFRSLKSKLLACYVSHFASVDPGVLSLVSAPTSGKRQLQLPERFVGPDLTQQAEVFADEPPPSQQQSALASDPALGEGVARQLVARIEDQPREEKTRISVENWIGNASHDIVLGLAGAGKSTLLRFIALDMLSESPRFIGLRRRFPDFLPVWVSFAFWTKLIAAGKDRCSLTLSHAARVAATPTLKAALLRCVEGNHLAFWAASALVDLWGATDEEVHSALNRAAEQPIVKRQNIAHVLPLVMADKDRCRHLLLEIVGGDDKNRIRADFALQGIRLLGIDASNREATIACLPGATMRSDLLLGMKFAKLS